MITAEQEIEESQSINKFFREIPLGVLLTGSVIAAVMCFGMTYLLEFIWLIGHNWALFPIYFRYACAGYGGFCLVYLIVCMLSKKFLFLHTKNTFEADNTLLKIRKNIEILFTNETLKLRSVRIILFSFMILLLLSIVGIAVCALVVIFLGLWAMSGGYF